MLSEKNKSHNSKQVLIGILIPVLFIFAVSCFYNLNALKEIDSDEGINLIKSHLILNGYKLYSEIWSDQPPVFTALLAGWIKLFGYEIFYARILILIFAAIIIWCLFEIIRRTQSNLAAGLAVFFIITSCYFLKLSVSILIGLPAIAFLMLSILFSIFYQNKRQPIFLILSGILFGVSIQTKFFTAFVAIAILTELIIFEYNQAEKKDLVIRCLKSIAFYLLPLILTYATIALLFKLDFTQIFDTHVKAETMITNGDNVFSYIFTDMDIYGFAIITSVIAFTKKIKRTMLPITWLLLGIVIFSFHNPFWEHHYAVVVIPACWLASICTSRFISDLVKKENRPKAFNVITVMIIVGFITTAVFIPIRVIKNVKYYSRNISNSKQVSAINQIVQKYKDVTNWSLFDKPIYSFNNRMLIPPELAVFTRKRVTTEYLTVNDIISSINKYKPELINFNRFRDLNSKVIASIKDDYILLGYNLKEKNSPPDNYAGKIDNVDFTDKNMFYLFVSKRIYSTDLIQ